MVALAFFSALFATASVGVPSVLIVPMSKDLGWSIGEIAAPTGLRLALFGLSAPFAGGLMLKYGPRRMVGLSGFVLIIGLIISIFTTEKWHLWVGMGILLGIGPGLTAMQLSSVSCFKMVQRKARTRNRFDDRCYSNWDINFHAPCGYNK